MRNKTKIILQAAAICTLLTSCDRISPDDRWSPLPDDEIPTNSCTVLAEEYTGQQCINCPDAAHLLQQQKKIYGDKLIIVSMHAPRTGMTTPELASPDADRFAEQYGHERSVPGIMLNREPLEEGRFYSQTPSLWASEIRKRILKPARYGLDILQVNLDRDNNHLTVNASAHVTNTARTADNQMTADDSESEQNGRFRMSFWIVEDVIAPQSLPKGLKEDYFHHNVFRGFLGNADGYDYQLQNDCTVTADLPATVKTADNAKLIVLLSEAQSDILLESRIYPLGKGITPAPDPEHPDVEPDKPDVEPGKPDVEPDKPDVEPGKPEADSKTLYFNDGKTTYLSGSEMIITTSILMDPNKKMYLMDSPLTYILPGKEYGMGNYDFTVSKVDHLNNADCGLMMVCIDGKCMPAEKEPEFYKGSIGIRTDTQETRQAFSIHTYIQGTLADKPDIFTYRISFLKEEQEISYLLLKLDFVPSTMTDTRN